MMVTLDELIKEARHVAARAGMDVSEGHPEDLVANLVPILEGIAAGYALGFMNGVRVPTGVQDAQPELDKAHSCGWVWTVPDKGADKLGRHV